MWRQCNEFFLNKMWSEATHGDDLCCFILYDVLFVLFATLMGPSHMPGGIPLRITRSLDAGKIAAIDFQNVSSLTLFALNGILT